MGVTSKVAKRNLWWQHVVQWRPTRDRNAENEKSPSMTGFLFMGSGLAGVFDFSHVGVRVRSDSRLRADFETF
ncbi:hypothetical protein AO263_14030 [Pseudomonas sp. NZIPFR-PS5]|nr:hypothetical protein AO263_14030 [Pseudomonas sp. NZIPFR-PS5]